MPTLPRRTALRRLSALALAVAAGKLRSSEAGALGGPLPLPRDGLDPFTLGVASGQPRPSSIVLWTRLAPRPLEPGGGLPPRPVRVRWQLAEDEGFARIVREGEALADPALAHSLRVTVDRLPADRRYFYRFIAGDATSPVGRTRTAPAADSPVERLRLALASCQHYEHGRFAVHREIAERDLDLVLFVGDYIYDSSNPAFLIRPHEGPQPQTLDGYRARHACYKLDADLQAAHAAHPWILAWDDHEVRNDYAAAWAWEDLDAAAFVQLRAAAYQAYFEHLPMAADQLPGADGAMRMHDRYVWGRLAELWTLDGRQHRDLQACNDDGIAGGRLRWRCDTLADAQRSLLGAAQEAWLRRGLVDSRRQWKLIGQATQMSPAGLEGAGQRLLHSDGWDGYPAARARLLGTLAEHRLQDVAVLGGDVHRHVVAALRERPADPASPVLASEFVATSITSRGLSAGMTELIQRSNPDILHARSDQRGYAYVEIGHRSLHFDARATAFPVVDRAKLHTQVKFVVESGQALPQRDG